MSSQVTIVTEKRSRRRWAAIGFILIVSLAVIAIGVADPIRLFAISHLKGLSTGLKTVTLLQQDAIFALIVFAILGLVAALIVTLFAPKKMINVKETDLQKERLDNVKYHKMQKKRQRKLNREMRDYVENKNK